MAAAAISASIAAAYVKSGPFDIAAEGGSDSGVCAEQRNGADEELGWAG